MCYTRHTDSIREEDPPEGCQSEQLHRDYDLELWFLSPGPKLPVADGRLLTRPKGKGCATQYRAQTWPWIGD